jgi:2-methylcitrate dehydratase PrpD
MITPDLAKLIASTEYIQLPEKVVDKAKLCFIDFLGVALRGSQTRSGKSIKGIIKDGDDSTVIGSKKASELEAGLANGIFAHSLELDDGHRLAQLHPGACVIPAALALCESRAKSGKEFISSMVVGYQVAISLGILMNPEHRRKGFHTTGTCGTFGATAAASKALNLNEKQIIHALGLAGTQAAGLLESDHAGAMAKHLHPGKAAHSGVLSALLAKEGFSGARTILEGYEGFFSAMGGADIPKAVQTPDGEKFPDREKFEIQNVYFKIYPVCRHIHSSIDALLHIIKTEGLKKEDVKEITVQTYRIAAEHDNYHPSTNEAIRQSLPVSLAIAVLNQDLKLNDVYLNQEIEDISRKIFIEYDEVLDSFYPYKRPARVIIKTKKRVFEKKIDLARGEPENPLKKQDIIRKFHDLNPEFDLEILEMVDDLESYHNMEKFMNTINLEFNRLKK